MKRLARPIFWSYLLALTAPAVRTVPTVPRRAVARVVRRARRQHGAALRGLDLLSLMGGNRRLGGRQLGLHPPGRAAVRADGHVHGHVHRGGHRSRHRRATSRFIPGAASPWREVRTYGEYVYVTHRGALRARHHRHAQPGPPARRCRPGRARSCPRTRCGSTPSAACCSPTAPTAATAGCASWTCANPEDPEELGAFTGFYVHDSYSRGNTLYAAAINDGFLALLDVSNPRDVREVTRFFTGGRFTHNAWLDARRALPVHDRRALGPPAGRMGPAEPAGAAQGLRVHRARPAASRTT